MRLSFQKHIKISSPHQHSWGKPTRTLPPRAPLSTSSQDKFGARMFRERKGGKVKRETGRFYYRSKCKYWKKNRFFFKKKGRKKKKKKKKKIPLGTQWQPHPLAGAACHRQFDERAVPKLIVLAGSSYQGVLSFVDDRRNWRELTAFPPNRLNCQRRSRPAVGRGSVYPRVAAYIMKVLFF